MKKWIKSFVGARAKRHLMPFRQLISTTVRQQGDELSWKWYDGESTRRRSERGAPVSCQRCPPASVEICHTSRSSGRSASQTPRLRVWAGCTYTPVTWMRRNYSCHTPCRRTRKRARIVLRLSSFLYPSNWLNDEKDLFRLDLGVVFGTNLDDLGPRGETLSTIGDGRETFHDFH